MDISTRIRSDSGVRSLQPSSDARGEQPQLRRSRPVVRRQHDCSIALDSLRGYLGRAPPGPGFE